MVGRVCVIRLTMKIGILFRLVFALSIFSTSLAARDAVAECFIVSQRVEFVKVITGKQLERPFIKLRVSNAGDITGRALLAEVRGSWTWEKGYFCRDLFWGKKELGYNCQQVSLSGDKIRFTSDEGKGDYADFNLK